PAADLPPRDLSAVPIGVRVIDHAVIEMRRNLLRPGMEIVLEFHPHVLLAVQPNRRQMREFPFQAIDFVHPIFFAQMGIHVENFHRTASRQMFSSPLSAMPPGLAIGPNSRLLSSWLRRRSACDRSRPREFAAQ